MLYKKNLMKRIMLCFSDHPYPTPSNSYRQSIFAKELNVLAGRIFVSNSDRFTTSNRTIATFEFLVGQT